MDSGAQMDVDESSTTGHALGVNFIIPLTANANALKAACDAVGAPKHQSNVMKRDHIERKIAFTWKTDAARFYESPQSASFWDDGGFQMTQRNIKGDVPLAIRGVPVENYIRNLQKNPDTRSQMQRTVSDIRKRGRSGTDAVLPGKDDSGWEMVVTELQAQKKILESLGEDIVTLFPGLALMNRLTKRVQQVEEWGKDVDGALTGVMEELREQEEVIESASAAIRKVDSSVSTLGNRLATVQSTMTEGFSAANKRLEQAEMDLAAVMESNQLPGKDNSSLDALKQQVGALSLKIRKTNVMVFGWPVQTPPDGGNISSVYDAVTLLRKIGLTKEQVGEFYAV